MSIWEAKIKKINVSKCEGFYRKCKIWILQKIQDMQETKEVPYMNNFLGRGTLIFWVKTISNNINLKDFWKVVGTLYPKNRLIYMQ